MNLRRPLLPSAFLLAATLVPVGCGGEPAAAGRTSSVSFVEVDNLDGGVDVTIDGVALEFEGGLDFRYRQVSSTPGGSEREMSVDGLPTWIEGGVLTIGEARFEGLVSGDRVVLGRGGISVNGERRWDWPGDGRAGD